MAVLDRMLRWPTPALMLITDRGRLRGRSLAEVASQAAAGGVNVVQLREKELTSDELCELATALRAALGDGALLIVNTSVEVARTTGADGVHLPERSVPLADERATVGEDAIIGRSVHSVEAAVRAAEEGVDYVQAGTVFATDSKHGIAPAGVGLVREIADAVRIPVVGVGGITASNAAQLIDAGASGVAVIGAIMDADDPREAAARLRCALDEAHG